MLRITWMEPNILAAGGVPVGAEDLRSLQAEGIRAVVSLIEHPLTTQREIAPELFNQLDIVYFHAPIIDGQPPSIDVVASIMDFMNRMAAQGRPVYVHCQAGIGRTGTILHTYYLMQGLSLDQAMETVKLRRPVCAFLMLTGSQRQFLADFSKLQGA